MPIDDYFHHYLQAIYFQLFLHTKIIMINNYYIFFKRKREKEEKREKVLTSLNNSLTSSIEYDFGSRVINILEFLISGSLGRA